MPDWKSRLEEADRTLSLVLPDDDVRRIRRRVLSAAEAGRARPMRVPRPFAWTMAALVLVSAGILGSLQQAVRHAAVTPRTETADRPIPDAAEPGSGKQQLQFATPGGTRIIWVFDSEFDVKGTLP
jgi:hypothetical protein